MAAALTFTLERHQPLIATLNIHHRAGSMATATPYTFGVDVSHWQGDIDWVKVKAAGFSFAVIKATEGAAYTDPRMASFRAGAHAAGLVVLLYGYAGSSASRRVYDPVVESNYFARAVAPLAVGEGAALDYEPSVPPPDPPAWSRAWLDNTRKVLAVPGPWIYMNRSTEARSNWSPLAVDYGLWLALYDNDPDPDPVVHWPNLTAEQYWDKATVPGIPGLVDVDVFYGPLSSLLAFCKQGSTPPEDDMAQVPQAEWNEIRDKVREEHGWLKGGDPAGRDNITLLWLMVTDIHDRLIGGQHGTGTPEEGDRLNDLWLQGQQILAASDPASLAQTLLSVLPTDLAAQVVAELVALMSRPKT